MVKKEVCDIGTTVVTGFERVLPAGAVVQAAAGGGFSQSS